MVARKEKQWPSTKLKVAEAVQSDVNKGIVRLDSNSMKGIGVNQGDVVEIKGGKSGIAIVDRAFPADIGLNIIRMDGLLRSNAQTSIGELVSVSRAEVRMAKKITIAPTQKGVSIRVVGSSNPIHKSLLGRALMRGDIISLGGTKSRRTTLSGNPLFDDIFRELISEDFMMRPFLGFTDIKWVVTQTDPTGPVLVVDSTTVNVSEEAVTPEEKKIPDITYEDIGGLDEEINKIREMVELPMRHPELFERLGVEPPKGVLLHGPPGTGKTLLAKAVANESNAFFISIAGPEIISKWVGEAEKRLREVFKKAEKNAPSIIFIDELDAIAPKREEVTGEVERRVVAQLLNSMDGLKSRGKVVVIAATNRPDSIDPALRRPGRFDRELVIGVPGVKARLEILKIHTRNMPIAKGVDLKNIASITHGFVGADLEAICKEAAMHTLRRLRHEIELNEGEPIDSETLKKIIVTKEDFGEGLKLVFPSAMREVLIEVPRIKWSDVGGLENVKEKLREAVEWPLKYPKSFERLGIKPPKGVLLFGPPGCGKTLLAKAVATESEANFISVKGPELFSKWVGESERAVRKIFRKARQVAPCIIFFDELDSIAPVRGAGADSRVSDKVVNQILTEIDGVEDLHDVVVIAASNRPDIIDTSLLRPGRFDNLVFIPPPDKKARERIFEVHTKRMPLGKGMDLKNLAEKTKGYSGADIAAVCREAAMEALRKNKDAAIVEAKNFTIVLKKIGPSLRKEDIKRYQDFESELAVKMPVLKSEELRYFG